MICLLNGRQKVTIFNKQKKQHEQQELPEQVTLMLLPFMGNRTKQYAERIGISSTIYH
jgi:hypothetical protein